MNLFAATTLGILIGVVLCAARRWALMAMMTGVLYLTQGQEVQVMGLNMYALRFLELAGFARLMVRREFQLSMLNGVDRALLLVYGYTTLVFLLRSVDGQTYWIGRSTDAFLCYFTFRGLIEDLEDFRWFLRHFIVILAPYTALIVIEYFTGSNPFYFMADTSYGGWLREGRIRCSGSFRHPSLLGTLGATFFPLYLGLSMVKAERVRSLAGVGLCLIIVLASNSGGPAGATAVGLAGWLLWRMRSRMQIVRRSLVASIALLAILMKAPVWFLIARVSTLTGGDGWHRAYLIDAALRHLDQWWLLGMPITGTKEWFPYSLAATGGADITNTFISFGFTAGLGAIALLIFLFTRAFRGLGHRLQIVRSRSQAPGETEFLLWGMGVMLAVHIFNWFGITYFDQTYATWFMQLAAIAALGEAWVESESRETGAVAGLPDEMATS